MIANIPIGQAPQGNRLCSECCAAERAASGEYSAPTGELIVTAPVGFGRAYLIPILADFLKAYPDIKASLLLSDRVQSLFKEPIDLGLRIGDIDHRWRLSQRGS